MTFRRRLVGYAPDAVTTAMTELLQEQGVDRAGYQRELDALRGQNQSLVQQLETLEVQLQALELDVHNRSMHLLTDRNSTTDLLLTEMDRYLRVEQSWQSEINRLQGVLEQVQHMHSDLGTDVRKTLRRYLETLTDLRALASMDHREVSGR